MAYLEFTAITYHLRIMQPRVLDGGYLSSVPSISPSVRVGCSWMYVFRGSKRATQYC